MKKTLVSCLGGALCLSPSLTTAQTEVCKVMVTNVTRPQYPSESVHEIIPFEAPCQLMISGLIAY